MLMPTFKDSALSESSRSGQIEVSRSLDDLKTLIEHGGPQGILERHQLPLTIINWFGRLLHFRKTCWCKQVDFEEREGGRGLRSRAPRCYRLCRLPLFHVQALRARIPKYVVTICPSAA